MFESWSDLIFSCLIRKCIKTKKIDLNDFKKYIDLFNELKNQVNSPKFDWLIEAYRQIKLVDEKLNHIKKNEQRNEDELRLIFSNVHRFKRNWFLTLNRTDFDNPNDDELDANINSNKKTFDNFLNELSLQYNKTDKKNIEIIGKTQLLIDAITLLEDKLNSMASKSSTKNNINFTSIGKTYTKKPNTVKKFSTTTISDEWIYVYNDIEKLTTQETTVLKYRPEELFTQNVIEYTVENEDYDSTLNISTNSHKKFKNNNLINGMIGITVMIILFVLAIKFFLIANQEEAITIESDSLVTKNSGSTLLFKGTIVMIIVIIVGGLSWHYLRHSNQSTTGSRYKTKSNTTIDPDNLGSKASVKKVSKRKTKNTSMINPDSLLSKETNKDKAKSKSTINPKSKVKKHSNSLVK
ncbi:hypothetical protein BLOT_010858 [Blomia tropicalis]|nr:hypothetical protein BLOT_010858 [Blomia tropicalis]